MSLSVGIVGLPNSGKSTLFNALLKKQIAKVSEYPYTTIEPNVGVVEVPDNRLSQIANRLSIPKIAPAAIKFIDIAGLIKGANLGEGLGNQFLAHIREVDAILHVVRAFENDKVLHVHGKIDPKVDVEIVNLELELGEIKKPSIYVLNVSEQDLKKDLPAGRHGFNLPFPYIKICAKLEVELLELPNFEQKEYLKSLGITQSSLDQVILASYKLLDLITFFTVAGGKQSQAWPVKTGTKIVEAAELVHTDFAKNFIKAEIIPWDKLVEAGSWVEAREEGLIKIAGKDEIVLDGQVIEFKI